MPQLHVTPAARRQYEILTFIAEYVEEHGYPPAVREICDGCGLASTSNVHRYLCALEQLGWLIRTPGVSRGIRITHDGRTALEA